ncbi:MAG: hypothetical protein LUC93_14700 [Planctomycetaceae bacterium]|nr:hypothetical protein [Planctomycetaceae bacterium]
MSMKDAGGSVQSVNLTSSEMMFLIYASQQIGQSERVAKTTELASAMADYANAASNLTTTIGLLAAAFDGEYFKSGMAPEGSASLRDGRAEVNAGGNLTDVNFTKALMSYSHIKSVIRDYVALQTAHQRLTTAENKAMLDELNITVDALPDFPLLDSGLPTTSPITIANFSYIFQSITPQGSLSTVFDMVDAYKNQVDDPPLTCGTEGYSADLLYDSDGSFTGGTTTWITVKFSTTGDLNLLINQDTGLPDVSDATTLSFLAAYCLGNNGPVFTASKATEQREVFNNAMNKTNTSTQSLTQYTTRSLSKLDSLQSMVDRNISKIFDNFAEIARGY